jgi:hypothetical protein
MREKSEANALFIVLVSRAALLSTEACFFEQYGLAAAF